MAEVSLLQSLLEETQEGVLVVGADGRFLFLNAAGRKLAGVNDLPNLAPSEWTQNFGLFHTDGLTPYAVPDLPLNRILKGETIEKAELYVRNPSAPQGMLLELRGRPLLDEDGKIKGGVVFFNDITRRKEEQLRAQRTADLVAFSPISIIETTPDARVVSWNAAAEKIYGYKPEEIVGKSYSRLIPLDKLPEVQAQIKDLKKGMVITEHETVRLRKDGQVIVTWCSASPLYDQNYHVRGFALVTRDMTHRRTTPLVELLPEAIVLTTLDGTITSWNAGAVKIFGYAKETMLGKNVMGLFPPEAQLNARQLVERAKFGESLFDYDAMGRHQSGEAFPISLTLLPSRDEANRVVNLTLIARDVTERKQAEERISQLTALVDHSQEGVARDDLNGNILYWNKAAERIYGYSAEEVLGKPFSMFVPEGTDDFLKVVGYIKEGRSIQYEGVRRRKDGRLINISATLVPLRDLKNEVCGASVFISDITERVQLREALRTHEEKSLRSQKMEAVGRLASGVAHDFNNWIMVIKANLHAFEKESLGTEAKEAVLNIQEVARLATNLTRQLLLVGRGQAAKLHPADLNELLIENQKLVKPLLKDNQKLSLDLAPQLPWIETEPSEFQQAVTNLVMNAKDAMPGGGEILLRSGILTQEKARQAAIAWGGDFPWVYFSVKDEGEGMDEKTRLHIFDPFFTTKPEGKGTGLGLALVYSLVGKSGGQVWVESEKGKGSTFYLAFPGLKKELEALQKGQV